MKLSVTGACGPAARGWREAGVYTHAGHPAGRPGFGALGLEHHLFGRRLYGLVVVDAELAELIATPAVQGI